MSAPFKNWEYKGKKVNTTDDFLCSVLRLKSIPLFCLLLRKFFVLKNIGLHEINFLDTCTRISVHEINSVLELIQNICIDHLLDAEKIVFSYISST